MKALAILAKISLAIFILIGPVSARAQVLFQEIGTILEITNNSINISDAQYRLSPTLKIALENKKRGDTSVIKGSPSQLKKGNYVQITVIKINQRRYVDTIIVLSETSPKKR